MATKPMRVWASKAKLRSTINWLVSVSGNMNSKVTVLNPPVVPTATKLVWHSLVWNSLNTVLSTTVVTTAWPTTSAHGPTFCQSSVAIPGPRLTYSWLAVLLALQPTVTPTSSAWLKVWTLLLSTRAKTTVTTWKKLTVTASVCLPLMSMKALA